MPPMVGTATVTGKTGPARTVTAQALTDVSSIVFDIASQIIKFNFTPLGGPPRSLDIAMDDISSITSTITEGISLAVTVTNA